MFWSRGEREHETSENHTQVGNISEPGYKLLYWEENQLHLLSGCVLHCTWGGSTKGPNKDIVTPHTHTHTICNIIHTKLLYCFWTGSMQCDIPYLVCLPVKIYYQFFWWRRWIARLVQKRGKGVLPAGCEWLLEICCWEIPHCAVKAVGRFRCSNSLKPELAFFQM